MGAVGIAADELRAVGGENRGFDANFAGDEMRTRAEGNLASTLQFMQERAFGGDASARFGVVE